MNDQELRFGHLRLDVARRVLMQGDEPVRIGPRATELLLALVARRGQVVTKGELLDLVWPGLVVEENNLQQHISALRKLFGAQAIVTVPGRGYVFALTPDCDPAPVAPVPRTAQVPVVAPLIGREDELTELLFALRSQRLVSVVGPGGVGKTRLALAAAHACESEFADGAWRVDLAVLAAGAQVPSAVAHALGVVLASGADGVDTHAATMAAALRGRSLLLVLDNCEHVVDAVAVLVDMLLPRAPGLRILATSQEPLHVAEEQVFRLSPLALPPADGGHALSPSAACSGAVQLFVARARAADRHFRVTDDTLPPIVDICRRLDGMPLAIELAAARVPLLGVQVLRQRLHERLQVLGTRPGRGPLRQQTLQAALSWSHALLKRDEQVVWRRLGVFAGGFSLDLALRVLVDDEIDADDLLDHLGALVDKSLLMAEAGDDPAQPRYRLLEPARAYALAQLDAAGEVDVLRLRHARALGDFLQQVDDRVVHERRFDALVRCMAAELDNLRAAMRWLAGHLSEATAATAVDRRAIRLAAIRLAAYGDWLWSEVDSFGEGLHFCRLARGAIDDDIPVALSARLRLSHQLLARTRLRPAAEWAVDAPMALQGFRQVGDRVGLYRALCALGGAPRGVVDDGESVALLDEAARLECPDWSPVLLRRRQAALEWCHDQGGRDEPCRQAGLRSVELAHQAGGVGEIAALGNLADTEFALGRVDDAVASCRRAIAVARELRRPEEAFNAFQNIVPALLARGDLDEAFAAIVEGRELLLRCLGSASGMLMPLALLAHRRGDLRLALQLLGCADQARADEGLDLHSPERRMRDAVLTAGADAGLGDDAATALRAGGARWSVDEGLARGGLDGRLAAPVA